MTLQVTTVQSDLTQMCVLAPVLSKQVTLEMQYAQGDDTSTPVSVTIKDVL